MIYNIEISPDLILATLKPGHEIKARCTFGLPDGVKLITAWTNRGFLTLRFEGPPYAEQGPDDEVDLPILFEALP